MEYRTVKYTTETISRIGFGCMSLKAGTPDAAQIVDAAVDSGINFFDTADLYEQGANEEQIGKLLKPHRNNIVIATKVGNEWRKDGSGWDWNPRKSYIIQAVEASLKRLQVHKIDLYQLHGGTMDDPYEETIDAFETLKAAGKIGAYGISSIRPNVIRRFVSASNISTVMMQYSLLDRRPEETSLPLLKQYEIGVLARGTLASGLLINKPAKDYLGHSAAAVKQIAQQIATIAKQYHISPTAVALHFVLANPAISSAVVGIRTIQQLQEIVTASNESLPEDAIKELQETTPALKYEDHR